MEPERKRVESKRVVGIRVRTSNPEESEPATASLPGLWGRFLAEGLAGSIPGRREGGAILGVYSSYEPDGEGGAGRYDVTAGVEVAADATPPDGMVEVAVPAGDYLVFEARGEMPAVVVETWQRVWKHFESERALERAFTVDFEEHVAPGHVAIHIAVRGR